MTIEPYLEEIKEQINSALELYKNEDIQSSNKLHYFMIHATVVYKILYPYVNERKILNKQKGWEAEVRKKKRAEGLAQYFQNSITREDSIKDFRNFFEHVDERIDEAIKSGFIIRDNIAFGGKIEDFVNIGGLKQSSKLENIENGILTVNGKKHNAKDIKTWLEKILLYIENHQILSNEIGGMCNCIFISN